MNPLQVLGLLFSIAGGYFAGWLISRYTKEEIRQGRKYLRILSVVLFVACIFAAWDYIGHRTDNSLAVLFSSIFLLMLPVAGLRHS